MKKFTFHLSGGRVLLFEGDSVPTDRAKVSLKGEGGTLMLGGKQFAIGENGTVICAEELSCGVHIPVIFVRGKRYEGPPISVGGGYFSFLPPTHEQISRLEERLKVLEAAHTELSKRICAIENRMQDTHIF
jgi:hypothetical protein